MGLFQKAIETYDAMQSLAGKKVEGKETLAPVGYMITTASIEITVDADGNFICARRINERIPIPCTEKSSERTSTSAAKLAHPLCDKLCYVAELDDVKHEAYLNEIQAWTESEYVNQKVKSVYKYLLKNTVLKDCKSAEVLELDKKGTIKNTEEIVTWRVEGLEDNSGAVHEDTQLMADFLNYYTNRLDAVEGICMLTGNHEGLAQKHPGVIVKAKLVSSNDTSNYTYRGRFVNSDEAVTIGYIASQKSHNAIKWLLSNYAVSMGNRRIVCWNPKGRTLPQINLPLMSSNGGKVIPSDYKSQLRAVVNGYKGELPDGETVIIASFEDINAGKGRLSITYYNELQGSDFLDRLYYWDLTCCWHDNRWGTYSPSLYQIVNFAFGTQRDSGKVECDSKILGSQMQRLISCRLDKTLFPRDIMRSLVIKASNLQTYEKNADTLLFVTCAVIKKCRYDYHKEEWDMALDENSTDRSYQFGRLLAVLEKIEKDTYRNDEDRETNAIRAQAFYSQRPLTAFSQIMTALKTGYYPRLSNGTKVYYEKLIGTIMEKISNTSEDVIDKPLTETYLMGYYLQKNALYTKKDTNSLEEE